MMVRELWNIVCFQGSWKLQLLVYGSGELCDIKFIVVIIEERQKSFRCIIYRNYNGKDKEDIVLGGCKNI